MIHRRWRHALRLLLGVTIGGLPVVTAPVASGRASNEISETRTLVIVHSATLNEVADEWKTHREAGGWNVVLHAVPPITEPRETATAIQAFIRETHRTASPKHAGDFAVLLLGDVPDAGEPDGIPAWKFPQRDPLLQSLEDREYLTDQPYQLIDDDRIPDVPLGRIPAHTAEQARAALAKIKRYEMSATQLDLHGRDRVVYVAGEGHFGIADTLLEGLFKQMVDQLVPDSLDLSMTYAKPTSPYCPPPSKLRQTVIERLTGGSLLFNYVGHGFERGFDSLHYLGKRYPILRVRDLEMMPSSPRDDALTPVAFMSCCSVGWFDLPKHDVSLSEALLFHPAGPVAIISGSRITHPYANTVLQKDITQAMLADRAPTAGMLDLMATKSVLTIDATDRELDALATPIALGQQWKTSLMGLRRMHAELYNLLGDPAMPLVLPPPMIDELKIENGTLSGRADGIANGTAFITIESIRTAFAHPERMKPMIGSDDADLEIKAANNYPLSGDRELLRLEAPIVDGAFSITLPEPLPMGAGLIRVRCEGKDAAGTSVQAIGAVRVAATPPAP